MKQVACTLPEAMYESLRALAEASGLTMSGYARKAIIRTVQAQIYFTEEERGLLGLPIAQIPPPIDIEEVLAERATEKPPEYKTAKRKHTG